MITEDVYPLEHWPSLPTDDYWPIYCEMTRNFCFKLGSEDEPTLQDLLTDDDVLRRYAMTEVPCRTVNRIWQGTDSILKMEKRE